MGHTHLLTRGFVNVRTEIALHVLAYNIKRMVTLIGIPGDNGSHPGLSRQGMVCPGIQAEKCPPSGLELISYCYRRKFLHSPAGKSPDGGAAGQMAQS